MSNTASTRRGPIGWPDRDRVAELEPGSEQELREAQRHEERLMVRTVVEVLTRQRAGGTTWEIDWCIDIGQGRIRKFLLELEADGEVRRPYRRGNAYCWVRVGVMPCPPAIAVDAPRRGVDYG